MLGLVTGFAAVLLTAFCYQAFLLIEQGGVRSVEELEDGVTEVNLFSDTGRDIVHSVKGGMGIRTDGVMVRDGISYFVEDLEHLKRRGSYSNGDATPFATICDFSEQLNLLDKKLVVVIVDGKGGGKNKGTLELVRKLRGERIGVVHIGEESKGDYLKHDSHWTPRLMEDTAQKIAKLLNMTNGTVTSVGSVKLSNKGDLTRNFLKGQSAEVVELKVYEKYTEKSGILVLGDSYCNIYSDPAMGWGSRSGFAETLGSIVQSSVPCIAVNGDGGLASRRELHRNAKLLDEAEVVVWQFAARELDKLSWQKIDFRKRKKLNEARMEGETGVYVVVEIAKMKKKIYPTALREVVVRSSANGNELLLRILAREKHKDVSGASLKLGDEIRLRVLDWKAVEAKYARVQIYGLDRFDLDVHWGSIVE